MSSNTTEHGEHFNESIVNEVILEDMKKNRIDHMKYLPGMETMEESDVMEQVITAMNAYDYDQYTEKDVRRALEHDNRTVEDFQALLSPAALPLLEEIAQAARVETRKHFGNSVYMLSSCVKPTKKSPQRNTPAVVHPFMNSVHSHWFSYKIIF